MESAEPEILDLQAELDEKYKNMPIEEKPEVKQEDVKMDTENRENEAPNEVKGERIVNAHKEEEEEDLKPLDEKAKFEVEEVNCKKEEKVNCIAENSKYHEEISKNDIDSVPDAKNSVTSEEIKQESEIKMDVDVKVEDMKKEIDADEKSQKALIKTMDDKVVDAIPNGDKFNHVNNLHNGKDVNGTFIGKCLLIEMLMLLFGTSCLKKVMLPNI